ncbi:kappa-type opioid receptor-like isoform X2 [Bufo gargarizans]|nr:kappa-type opioid receptor-like isoform X2 [Bufo gargarizans]
MSGATLSNVCDMLLIRGRCIVTSELQTGTKLHSQATHTADRTTITDKMSMNITHPPFFHTQDSVSTENTLPRNDTSEELNIVLCCVYIGNTLLGMTVNILVMWSIWPEVSRSLGLPIYAASILCAALLECLILPFGAVYLLGSLAVGPVGCFMLGLIPKVAQRTATMFTLWIFIVRYVAVSDPLNYNKLCKGWVFGSVSITLWLTAFTISLIEEGLARDDANFCFPDYSFTAEWALPKLILSFLYSHLSVIHLCIFTYLISRSVRNSDTVPSEQYKRICRLLVFVVITFGVFFCPMHIVLQYYNIIMLLGESDVQVLKKLHFFYQIMFAFNSFSVVITPIFYIISSSTVNTRVMGLFKGS